MTTEKYTYTRITLIKSHQIELYFNIRIYKNCFDKILKLLYHLNINIIII